MRAATLRALATLCSVLEAIRQLEEVRGVEVIARLLGDLTISEADRAEAAGVLAQILSPWIDGNTNIQEIDCALTDIVISLKGWWGNNYFYPGYFYPAVDSHKHTAPRTD